ncbi:MAG TPA: MASE3 domain-containing protein [Geobacteraceae bacterium]
MTDVDPSPSTSFAISFGMVALAGLYVTSRHSYLLFHSLIEMFSVVIACGIFAIAWNSRRIMANNYFLFVGIASLFVGGIDLLHTLSYKGMGVFPGNSPNLPTQFWIVARYLQSFSLLVAPFLLGRRLRASLAMMVFAVATSLLILAVFGGFFPDCFVAGQGLTAFKKGSEYVICLTLCAALVCMRRRMRSFDPGVVNLMSVAIALFIASELSFTLYTDVYGIANMTGHLLKFVGFFLVYKALIETGLVRPYDLLFRELKESEESYRALYIERREAAQQVEELNAELAVRAEDLEESNCQLENALVGLEAVNHELEAANRELEAFNYTVSHDLRGPLTAIAGFSQILLDARHERLDTESREFVVSIVHAARRMEQLITTLLDFSRLSRHEVIRTSVDLSALATLVAADVRSKAPERMVLFAIQEGLHCHGDAKLLKVVLDNLMGNAWKYTARREDALIRVGQIAKDGVSAFFVCDNGTGFEMARADQLFAPFQRLHDAEEFEGYGVGLATVRRIIERHGGRVWAEGVPGEGATFYFTVG